MNKIIRNIKLAQVMRARPTVSSQAHYSPSLQAPQLVNLQARMVHERGYNDFSDMPGYIFHRINGALMHAKQCSSYAYVFEHFSDSLTDTQIAYAFHEIALDNVERTPEFWNVILPRVKEQVPTLDR